MKTQAPRILLPVSLLLGASLPFHWCGVNLRFSLFNGCESEAMGLSRVWTVFWCNVEQRSFGFVCLFENWLYPVSRWFWGISIFSSACSCMTEILPGPQWSACSWGLGDIFLWHYFYIWSQRNSLFSKLHHDVFYAPWKPWKPWSESSGWRGFGI